MCQRKEDGDPWSCVKHTADTMYRGKITVYAYSCLCGFINMCLQATDQMKGQTRGPEDTGRPRWKLAINCLGLPTHTNTQTHTA